MSEERTVEQVSDEIERQRTELAASVATVRHDLRGILVEQVPRVGIAAAVVLGALIARRFARGRRKTPTEWLRFGKFAVVERN